MVPNENLFLQLRVEWERIVDQENSSWRRWEEDFASMQAEYERLRREGLWVSGPADLLGILGRGRREIYHSAILAWLFDPCARHGLGTGFLQEILRLCFPELEFGDLSGARPECEVTRADNRADIVVWGEDLTLIIENKIDAGEQPRQCDGLYEKFCGEPGALFVFLTPHGHAPRTATGEAQKAFRCLSYRQLQTILRSTLEEAPKATYPQGRESAWNYLSTLEREL